MSCPSCRKSPCCLSWFNVPGGYGNSAALCRWLPGRSATSIAGGWPTFPRRSGLRYCTSASCVRASYRTRDLIYGTGIATKNVLVGRSSTCMTVCENLISPVKPCKLLVAPCSSIGCVWTGWPNWCSSCTDRPWSNGPGQWRCSGRCGRRVPIRTNSGSRLCWISGTSSGSGIASVILDVSGRSGPSGWSRS